MESVRVHYAYASAEPVVLHGGRAFGTMLDNPLLPTDTPNTLKVEQSST